MSDLDLAATTAANEISAASKSTAAAGEPAPWTITIRGGTFDEVAIELGCYFLLVTFCMLKLLDQVRGKPRKLENWLYFRKLTVFRHDDRNSAAATAYLKWGLYYYVCMPVLTLLGWSGLVVYSTYQDNQLDPGAEPAPLWSGLCIFLLGTALMLFGYNVLKVKWSNYRFKTRNLAYLGVVLLLVSAYQFLVVFGYEHEDKFLPYSAIFLNINITLLAIIIFLSKYKDRKGVADIVTKFFPERGTALRRDRDDDLVDEITAQGQDPNWKQSAEDLADIITVSKVSGDKFSSVIGDGFLARFKRIPRAKQNTCQTVMGCLSVVVLLVYAFVLYSVDKTADGRGSKMGIITTVSILLMDMFNLTLYHSGNIKTPSQIIILLIVNRALMVGLGQSYWVYGYLILYLMYALVFVSQIARNRFPLEGDIVLQSAKLDNFTQREDGKKLSKKEAKALLSRSFNNPEFLLLLLSLLYLGLMALVSVVDIRAHTGAAVAPFIVTIGAKSAKLEYWQVGLLSIFLVISFYFVLALYRIYVRKATGAEALDQKKSCLKKWKKIGPMGFFSTFVFLVCWIWGLVAYAITSQAYLVLSMAVGSMALLSFCRGYVYFILNEYDYSQDVTKLNKNIDRHNKDLDLIEQKKDRVQAMIAQGELKLPSLKDRDRLLREAGLPSKGAKDGGVVSAAGGQPVDGADPASPDGLDQNDAAEEQRLRDDEENNRQMQEDMRLMIQKEQEKKQREQAERRQHVEEDDEFRAQEEEDEQNMQEQLQMEKQRKEQEKQNGEAQRKRKIEEKAQQQRAQERARRETEQNKPAVQQSQDNELNFAGKIQVAEVQERDQGFREEEIYEGGEEAQESPPAEEQKEEVKTIESNKEQIYDPAKEYINADDYEEVDGGPQKIARTRLKRAKDWRLRHKGSWQSAYRAGELRPNDYYLFHSFAFSFLSMLILMGTLYATMKDVLAVMIVLPAFFITICLLLASTVIYQSRTFTGKELALWIVVNVVYVAAGAAYFVYKYEVSTFSYSPSERHPRQAEASKFVFLYILLMPTLAHALVVVLRIIDRGTEGFDAKFKYFVGGTAFGFVLMIVSVFFFVHYIEGIICVCVLLLFIYVAAQFSLYIKNGYYMKPIWTLINNVLAIGCIAAASIYAGLSDDMTTYQGATISCYAWLFFLWAYAIFQFTMDYRNFVQKPIYYSPTLFPIYKYNPKINDVEDHYEPAIAWIAGLVLLVFWGFFSNYQLSPTWFGVVVTVGIQLIVLITMMNMRAITIDSMDDAYEFIDQTTVKKAWIETKLSYVKNKGSYSRLDLLTYRRAWVRRFYLNSYIAATKGKTHAAPNKVSAAIKEETKCEGSDRKAFYKNKVDDFVDFDEFNPNDMADMAYLAHVYDMIVHETYLDELQQLLQFVMISVQNSLLVQQQIKKDFIRFLNNKMEVLNALGINIQVPTKGTVEARFEQIDLQVAELSEKENAIFQQLKLMYELESRAKRDKSKAVAEAERDRQDQRSMNAEEQKRRKEEQLTELQRIIDQRNQEGGGEIDLDMDIDNMPDCRLKYQIIVKRSQQTEGEYAGYKFEDKQFPPNDDSIGPGALEGGCRGSENVSWPRVSEKESSEGEAFTIFRDGVDEGDIIQGGLGDCYFLSAMAVLSGEDIRDKFIFEMDDEWRKCGAFCIKFYNNGKEDVIIIDDHFPFLTDEEDFAFCRSRSENELWPMILEKAYAKKFGSFTFIQGGLIDNALSDLTNGIPERHAKDDNENVQKFWDSIIEWQTDGGYLGAGSPAHEDGDKAKSDSGIAQGHAYSILQCTQVGKLKLIKIRNPWGHGEWTGDWSDDSELWTTRIRNILNFDVVANDGIFWMDFNDFLFEFDTVYVCRSLTEKQGWKNLNIQDQWVGKYACGLPTKANRKAKMAEAPQYSITINKPGKGFVIMRLAEKTNSFKAKQAGYLNLQANEGELITAPNKKRQLGVAGPSKMALQSLQVEFGSQHSYPYTFTAIITNLNHGSAGEGNFSLQIFSKDFKMVVAKMN